MATKSTFVVQSFEIRRKKLVPSTRDVAPTAGGAVKRAEAIAGRLPGAAALKIDADDETGELHAVEVLAQFGDVPEDFRDSLVGG